MLKFNAVFALVLTGLLPAAPVSAQAPATFWTEDFSAGLPAGWMNMDASGGVALWTWCSNPEAGNTEAGCPDLWAADPNYQFPFQATTASNGFVTLDSDAYGNLGTDHISELTTTAIDASGAGEVWVTFESHIGVYTVDANVGAILRVSTDKTNWFDFYPFPELTTGVRWSANPEKTIIDISDVAAGQSTVYLQWQWTGNYEYQWSIDDVKVYNENPTPRHDLAISEFLYPVSSYATPASEIAADTFSFAAALSNQGLLGQTNIVLKATVKTEAGAQLFADSILIPALAAGVKDSAFYLDDTYVPDLDEGKYFIEYSVRADSADLDPLDDRNGDPFVVTTNLFAKEDGATIGYRPSGTGDWAVGNYYRMSEQSLEQYKASVAEFTFSTDPEEGLFPGDVGSLVMLLKVADDVAPDFSNFDTTQFLSPSLELLGLNGYDAPDTLEDYEMQTLEILDTDGNQGILLEPGGRYFLVVQYEGNSSLTYHAFNEDVSNFFLNSYFVSTVIYNEEWALPGFGPEANAVLRMYLDLVTTTDDRPLPDHTMQVFPNPVQDGQVNLAVRFDVPTDATITIADVNGRVLTMEDRPKLSGEVLQYRLPGLSPGTYLARIATSEGTLTRRFVVTR
jgi:hypothetical protein